MSTRPTAPTPNIDTIPAELIARAQGTNWRYEDELYRAVRPMLAVSGGRVVLLSSPYGRRGFFFDEWTNCGSAWQRFEVPATMIPRISAEFLAEKRRGLGPWYAQEYECQFLLALAIGLWYAPCRVDATDLVSLYDRSGERPRDGGAVRGEAGRGGRHAQLVLLRMLRGRLAAPSGEANDSAPITARCSSGVLRNESLEAAMIGLHSVMSSLIRATASCIAQHSSVESAISSSLRRKNSATSSRRRSNRSVRQSSMRSPFRIAAQRRWRSSPVA
jgi:hypothetical protein